MTCAGKDIARKHKPILMKKRSSLKYLLKFIEIDETTKCWNWTGVLNSDGYGIKKFYGKGDKTHRIFYELFKGEIPKGMCVCHKCDNRACCNPDHLWIGSRIDNNKDMVKKNRQRGLVGESNKSSKLTEKDVYEIRDLYKKGFSSRALGKKFNMDKSAILNIIHRKTWKHI